MSTSRPGRLEDWAVEPCSAVKRMDFEEGREQRLMAQSVGYTWGALNRLRMATSEQPCCSAKEMHCETCPPINTRTSAPKYSFRRVLSQS